MALSYSTEYRFMVSVGFDYEGIVWNPYVKHMILKLHGHTSSLCGVEIIPDTPQIITGDISGVFKVWDIRTFTCMQTFMMSDEGDENGKDGKDSSGSSSSFGSGGGGGNHRMSSFASITKHKRIKLVGRAEDESCRV